VGGPLRFWGWDFEGLKLAGRTVNLCGAWVFEEEEVGLGLREVEGEEEKKADVGV
jgi:hypothetical protein